jgi:hypothetical protein
VVQRPSRKAFPLHRLETPLLRKQNKAISWFKDSAKEHIARARSLARILENHGVSVTTIKTRRVGYVVYEDEYQITAEPFAGKRD